MPDPHSPDADAQRRIREARGRPSPGDVILARHPWPGAATRYGPEPRPCLVLRVGGRRLRPEIEIAPGVPAIVRPPRGADLHCAAGALRGVRGLGHPHTWLLGRRIEVALADPIVERDAAGVVVLGRIGDPALPRLKLLLARLDAGRALLDGMDRRPDYGRHGGPDARRKTGPMVKFPLRARRDDPGGNVVWVFRRRGGDAAAPETPQRHDARNLDIFVEGDLS